MSMNFCEELEGAEAGAVIVNVRGGDNFVGARDVEEIGQASLDGLRRADYRAEKCHAGGGFFLRRPIGIDVVDRRRNLARRAAAKICECLLDGGKEAAGFGVGVRDDGVQAEHDVWTGELAGRLEVSAIKMQRGHHVRRSEMRCEGEGQAEFSGELRAEGA